MWLRSIWFLVVTFLGCTGPLALFVVSISGYLLLYMGLELLLVGFFIDGYFGYGRGELPWYTLSITAGLIVARFLRPYISMYNR